MQPSTFARAVLVILLVVGCATPADAPDDVSTSGAPAETSDESTAETDTSATSVAGSSSSDPTTTTTTTTTTDDTTEATDDTSASTGPNPPVVEVPPTNGAELLPWLQSGEYLDWIAESAVHPSAGPHGGNVRTFVNTALFESLTAGSAVHPIDAAAVKELYYDGVDVVGWAVIVKVAPGEGGDAWYWYERVGNSVYADDIAVPLCFECHEIGVDQVRTPFPLQ